ncbi:transposase [Streptomyces sp. NPDC021056]|uniref:transposase n=1 Tax=Streptomyces sp. NPDC021056 TaxID=3155012 RepID=UPI0034048846
MPRRPALPPQEKTKIVLAVLSRECSIAEAARRCGVTDQSVLNWRRQFVEGGTAKLAGEASALPPQPQERELQLAGEVRKLKMALGEAYAELMTWRKVGDARRFPSGTSS